MTQAMFNSMLLALFGTALGVITTWFWKSRDEAVRKATVIAGEHEAALKRISDLEKKQGIVDAQLVPFNGLMQAMLIKELTHAHTPEMDALMVKLGPPNILTPAEERRLTVMLQERYARPDPSVSEQERDAAFILPAVIRRARSEAQVLQDAEDIRVKLVSIAAVVAVPDRTRGGEPQ